MRRGELVSEAIAHLFATRQDRKQRPPAPPLEPGQPDEQGPVEISNPEQYAKTALQRAHDELANVSEGGRNHALNATAYSLGRLVAAGLATQADVERTLLDACEKNGLLGEDGQYATEATLRSGLTGGARHPLNWTDSTPAPAVRPFNAPTPPAPVPPQAERTTWWPKNLGPILRGETDPEPPPAYLHRTDGHALFYSGKVNGLIGESESGKTWVALVCVAQALNAGHSVLYLDFEDTATGIIGRLRALGVHDRHLNARQFTYISPDETLSPPAERDLSEVIHHATPAVVILDGYNAAMTLLGLNLQDNTDVTAFSLRVLRPLKRTGAAVITIDHVTKSKEGRGSYAIGAQAKRADVDGCLISVEVTQAFGRGQTGRLKLTVSKDRPGHVRAISAGAKNAGEAILRSSLDGSIVACIDGPDLRPFTERGPFRPTALMERVSQLLEAASGPLTRTAVKNNVTGKDAAILQALDVLIHEQFVQIAAGGGVVSARQYRQDSDPQADERAACPDRARPCPGTAQVSVPPVPPSIGGTGHAPGSRPHDPEPEPDLRWDQR